MHPNDTPKDDLQPKFSKNTKSQFLKFSQNHFRFKFRYNGAAKILLKMCKKMPKHAKQIPKTDYLAFSGSNILVPNKKCQKTTTTAIGLVLLLITIDGVWCF